MRLRIRRVLGCKTARRSDSRKFFVILVQDLAKLENKGPIFKKS